MLHVGLVDNASLFLSMCSISQVSNAFLSVSSASYNNTRILKTIKAQAGKNKLTLTPTTLPAIKIGWNSMAIS